MGDGRFLLIFQHHPRLIRVAGNCAIAHGSFLTARCSLPGPRCRAALHVQQRHHHPVHVSRPHFLWRLHHGRWFDSTCALAEFHEKQTTVGLVPVSVLGHHGLRQLSDLPGLPGYLDQPARHGHAIAPSLLSPAWCARMRSSNMKRH